MKKKKIVYSPSVPVKKKTKGAAGGPGALFNTKKKG